MWLSGGTERVAATYDVRARERSYGREREEEREREREKEHGGGGCYGYTAAITIRPTIL